MPHIVGKTSGTIDDVNTSADMGYPLYEVDDVLIAVMNQDGGGTTIANTDTGWIEITTQASQNGQRTAVWYKIMSSTTETATQFTGRNETWAWAISAWRHVDTTTPIHQSTRSGWVSDNTSDTVTTTVDDCTILYIWGSDPFDISALTNPVVIRYQPSEAEVIEVSTGSSALTPEQDLWLRDLWRVLGLDPSNPMTVTPTTRVAGDIDQTISGDGESTSTVTRA